MGICAVLPYFRRAETCAAGADEYRGGDQGSCKPVTAAFRIRCTPRGFEAGQQAGYPPARSDINGFQQEGFGRLDVTVGGGRRWSAANAYLRPAMQRQNSMCARMRAPREFCSKAGAQRASISRRNDANGEGAA